MSQPYFATEYVSGVFDKPVLKLTDVSGKENSVNLFGATVEDLFGSSGEIIGFRIIPFRATPIQVLEASNLTKNQVARIIKNTHAISNPLWNGAKRRWLLEAGGTVDQMDLRGGENLTPVHHAEGEPNDEIGLVVNPNYGPGGQDTVFYQKYHNYIGDIQTPFIDYYSDAGFSISVWAQLFTSSIDQHLIEHLGYFTIVRVNQKIRAEVFDASYDYMDLGTFRQVESLANFPPLEWHHIVMTSNKDDTKLYIDTVLQGTDTTALGLPLDTIQPFNVAARADTTLSWKGWLNDLTIWNRIITGDEISELFASQGLLP